VRHTRAGKEAAVDGLDAVAVPTFDLVANDIESDAAGPRLFDFGTDPELPDTAPVAELPPWMRATAPAPVPAPEVESRRHGLPRARGHRRPYQPEFPLEPLAVEAPVVEVPVAEAVEVAAAAPVVEIAVPVVGVVNAPAVEVAAPVVGVVEVPAVEVAEPVVEVVDALAAAPVVEIIEVPTVTGPLEIVAPPAAPPAPRTVAEAAAAHAAARAVQGDIAVPGAGVAPAVAEMPAVAKVPVATEALVATETSVGTGTPAAKVTRRSTGATVARAARFAKSALGARASVAKSGLDAKSSVARSALGTKVSVAKRGPAAKSSVAKTELAATSAAVVEAAAVADAAAVAGVEPLTKPAPAPAVPAQPHPAPAPGRATAKAAKGDKARRITSGVGIAMALGGGLGALYIGTIGHHTPPTPLPESQLAANEWVVNNVGSTASVLAPAAVTKALIKDGFDSARVIPYSDGASGSTGSVATPDWKCCNVLFATTPVGDSSVRDGLPVALRPAYDQSRALASFTENGRTTEIRQVLNGTRADIAASLDSEHRVLVNAGKEVLANKKLHLSAAATREVKDGQVDSRVLLAIVGIAARHDVSVLDFPIGDAEQAVDGLAREVRIDKLDGKPLAAGSAAVSDADAFLGMQVDPYKPATMQLSDPDGSGSVLLDIRYDAPGPLGLITPGS
jgi:hypothetical protein